MDHGIEKGADPFLQGIVDAARDWIGTPYRHQASVKGAGADCLGLVRGIWRDVLGPEPASIPSYTPDWSEASGDEALMRSADRWLVRRSGLEWKMADILLFRMRQDSVAKHLGVVSAPSGTCRFIHAYTGHGVVESPLSEPWRRRVAAVYHFPKGV